MNTAKRELEEETGISLEEPLIEVGIFDDINRDPRGRVISVVYTAVTDKNMLKKIKPDNVETARVAWFERYYLPVKIAFDHEKIIQTTVEKLDL